MAAFQLPTALRCSAAGRRRQWIAWRMVRLAAATLTLTAARSLAAGLLASGCGAAVQAFVSPRVAPVRPWPRTQAAASATDTFDPWTVLGISTDAPPSEARKAYKRLITKYHPDVNPSREAEAKFQLIVRALAVVTGEDKVLDMSTLLKNAVENLRSDMEFKRQQIESLKRQAAEEEAAMKRMEEQLEEATVKRDKVTQELGAFGGAALGLVAGGPAGAILGAVVGLAVKDRDDAAGQVVRGIGTLAKSLVDAVAKAVNKKEP